MSKVKGVREYSKTFLCKITGHSKYLKSCVYKKCFAHKNTPIHLQYYNLTRAFNDNYDLYDKHRR